MAVGAADADANDGGGASNGGVADDFGGPLIITGVCDRDGGPAKVGIFGVTDDALLLVFGYNCASGISLREDEDEPVDSGGGMEATDGGGGRKDSDS